jgi:hypothetical protein
VLYVLLTCSEGSQWEEKKARQLSVNIPAGRIVSRVQVELTAVKMCIYETEIPTVDFVFAETSGNDPNPFTSTKSLPDTCGCNICPQIKEGIDWSAVEKRWSDSKEFILDVHFQGVNPLYRQADHQNPFCK